MPTRYNNDAVCATHNITLAGAGGWVRGKGSSNDGGSNPIVVLVRWERGWRRQSLRGSKRRQGGFPWYDLLQQQQQYGPATPHDLLRVGKGARTQQLQTSHFYGQRFFFFFRGEAPSLFGGREAEAFWFRRRFVRQAGLACRSFALFHFLFLRHFLRWTHAAHYCRIAKKKVSLLLLVQYYSNIVTTSKNMHEKKLQLQYTHTQRCSQETAV